MYIRGMQEEEKPLKLEGDFLEVLRVIVRTPVKKAAKKGVAKKRARRKKG